MPFFFSGVLRWGDLLWLLDDATSETEAGGSYGMIFWSKGLIFSFISSRFPRPLQGRCDFHSPDIRRCCEMLMETIFTWVATTSGTDIHARHSGHTGPFGCLQRDAYTIMLSYWQMIIKVRSSGKIIKESPLLLVPRTSAVNACFCSFFYYLQFNFSVDSFFNFFVMLLGTWQ